MVRTALRGMTALAVLAVVGLWAAGEAAAVDWTNLHYGRYGQTSDLFPQYYSPPGYGGQAAELYVSPRPVPPFVGHTWITYQPLLPHEFMYPHCRTYTRYHEAGVTTSHIRWTHRPF
ncbi:MAG: hypothetical protein ACOY3P_12215 [Planctomycetota bacterium]